MRPLMGLLRWIVLRHLRSPIVVVAVVLFLVLSLSLPTLGAPGTALRTQGILVLHCGAGGIVLLLLALVLPWTSVGWRRGRAPGGGPGVAGRQATGLVAHGLVIVGGACLLGLLTWGLAYMRIGNPDARGAPVAIRQVWGEGPEEEAALLDPSGSLALELPFEGLPQEHPVLRLRLSPRVVAHPSSAGGGSYGALDCPVLMKWRLRGRNRWHHQTLKFRRGRPQTAEIRLGDRQGALELGDSGNMDGTLDLRLSRAGGGQAAVFTEGSIVLLGPRGRVLSTVLRGFLLLALSALPVLVTCQWFSGFVSYPVAVGATLTAVLAGMLLSPWFPGVPLLDPAERIATGCALSWSDLGPTALKGALFGGVATVLPFVDRRVLEG